MSGPKYTLGKLCKYCFRAIADCNGSFLCKVCHSRTASKGFKKVNNKTTKTTNWFYDMFGNKTRLHGDI